MLLSVVDASVLVTCEAVTPPAQPSPAQACCRVMKQPAQPSPAQPSPAQPTLSLTARRGMPAGKPPRRRLELEPALERTQHPDTRAVARPATCDTNLFERVIIEGPSTVLQKISQYPGKAPSRAMPLLKGLQALFSTRSTGLLQAL